jgi:hypothetical protein
MKFTRSRTVASAAAGILAASTLGTVALTTGPAEAATAPTIRVHIGQHHHVFIPDRIRPGVHRFVVRSERQASFQLVHIRKGYTDRELARDVNASLNDPNSTDVKALKRFERNVTLLGGVSSAPGHPARMWVNLKPGRYAAADTNVRVTRPGQLHHFRVVGDRVAGTLPAGKRIAAIHETDWAARPKAIPTRGVLRFVNRSEDNHFIVMARLLPGKTVADFKAWVDAVMNGQDAPPPIDESAPGIDTGVVSPGHRMAFRYHLPEGHYILTCFWSDADMGGLPHAFMGMYRQLNVR